MLIFLTNSPITRNKILILAILLMTLKRIFPQLTRIQILYHLTIRITISITITIKNALLTHTPTLTILLPRILITQFLHTLYIRVTYIIIIIILFYCGFQMQGFYGAIKQVFFLLKNVKFFIKNIVFYIILFQFQFLNF